MKYELKPVEAEQVPERLENEAAKDYEQRLAKFCAWLDEVGCTEISFHIPTDGSVAVVEFREPGASGDFVSGYIRANHRVSSATPGLWLVLSANDRFLLFSDEVFRATYQEFQPATVSNNFIYPNSERTSW